MQENTEASPIVLDCGHHPTWTAKGAHEAGTVGPSDTFTTGYGHRPNNTVVCFPCCEREELAAFASAMRYTGYLSAPVDVKIDGALRTESTRFSGGFVTNWTGAILLRDVQAHRTRAGFGGGRWYFRGRAADGSIWFGTGPGPGQYASLRRTKRTTL